ncbi:hypothetical protein ACOME3_002991 [Neoechinorhynchus agilis]
MVKFLLSIQADLDGLSSINPSTGINEKLVWYFKFQCCQCGEQSQKFQSLYPCHVRKLNVEDMGINVRCSLCRRTNSAFVANFFVDGEDEDRILPSEWKRILTLLSSSLIFRSR